MLSCVDLLHRGANQIYILKSYPLIQNSVDFNKNSYLQIDSLNFDCFQYFSDFYKIYSMLFYYFSLNQKFYL